MITLPKLTGGPAFLVFSFGAQSVLRLAGNLILTRLLFPEAFGLMAIVRSVMFLVELSSDMGFKAFLIRHQHGDQPRYLDTVWSIKVIRGAILSLCLMALAYPISRFYDSAQLFPILVFTAITFFLRGVESMSLILAEREQKLVKLSLIELLSFVAQIAVTVILAYYFRNVWSLAIGGFFGVILLVGLGYLLFENSIRSFRIDKEVLAESWVFARVIMVSSVLTIVITQFDKFFIGKYISLEFLGIYIIAFNLAQAFVRLFQAVSSPVVFPRFSKAFRQSPEKLAASFLSERQKFVPYFLFAGGAFLISGDLLFQILFDPRYHEGGIYFSLLML
ncbi:MAG: oligosaccharide flippase family protein, partial [Proteobacteria bacterium]|nr:oligosaccharide flippase family protein [Pseudomonadota bacterium]